MAYSTKIDRKWQDKWNETDANKFDPNSSKEKLYVLEMFSYPSGSNLHVGHWYNYSLSDTWARMKKMQGYNVFQPMGFDAFGLPAENYAIKTGIHPQISTMNNIVTMKKQLTEMGGMFDWEYEVITCLPEYYKWNQWLFLKLYENGLAYRKNAPVNWCPDCNTVLANEQVENGVCERCGETVKRKNLTQWFFKITDYAQELLDFLPSLDWPEPTKKIQKNWIGRSEGSIIVFDAIKDGNQIKDENGEVVVLPVFTTRADTLLGVTYVVVAPESEVCDLLTTDDCKPKVEEYRTETSKVSDIDRMSTTREKTGVFTGSYAIHPLTCEKVPIWASDYVIAGYGSGVVMAVPAHDERDYEFAVKFNLPIKQVIVPTDGSEFELPFIEKGININSGEFNGLKFDESVDAIISKLEKNGKGEMKVNYRLRDWLVSRQRYWGTPIPIIYCDKCGIVPVPEESLPVILPQDVEFKPDGQSPLAKCESFINTTCPKCKGPAKRDADTLDTFVCSSWYQMRYVDNKNTKLPFEKEKADKMLPVDKYIGGSEHAAMHLLYSRFITKVLRDLGYLSFDEPFKSLIHQGTILGEDGQKMSKSKGNTISPDEYISQYGSDVFRMYLAFGFAYTDGGPWSGDGVKAIAKYINRVERIVDETIVLLHSGNLNTGKLGPEEKELAFARSHAIKSVTIDADKFQFNTSVARLMELLNALNKYQSSKTPHEIFVQTVNDLISLLSPFAPHFAEEMWNKLGHDFSIFETAWPTHDESALIKDEVEIAIQINGNLKGKIVIPSDASKEDVSELVLSDETIKNLLVDKTIVKFIYVPKRLANLVVKPS